MDRISSDKAAAAAAVGRAVTPLPTAPLLPPPPPPHHSKNTSDLHIWWTGAEMLTHGENAEVTPGMTQKFSAFTHVRKISFKKDTQILNKNKLNSLFLIFNFLHLCRKVPG